MDEYIMEAIVKECDQKQRHMIDLLQAKSEKHTNKYLVDKKHTQLSYLKEPERSMQIAFVKNQILDKFISILNKL